MPPWPFSNVEKSLRFKYLLIYEKKISPKNRKIAINDENKISKPIKNNKRDDKVNDINVPDQVFFGLIKGTINGPPIDLPNMYATVSLKNDIKSII